MINNNENTGLKMKNRSQKHDIDKPRPRYGHKYAKYQMWLSIMIVLCTKQHHSNFEAQFMKMLSNTKAELKKSVAYKKSVYNNNKIIKSFSN